MSKVSFRIGLGLVLVLFCVALLFILKGGEASKRAPAPPDKTQIGKRIYRSVAPEKKIEAPGEPKDFEVDGIYGPNLDNKGAAPVVVADKVTSGVPYPPKAFEGLSQEELYMDIRPRQATKLLQGAVNFLAKKYTLDYHTRYPSLATVKSELEANNLLGNLIIGKYQDKAIIVVQENQGHYLGYVVGGFRIESASGQPYVKSEIVNEPFPAAPRFETNANPKLSLNPAQNAIKAGQTIAKQTIARTEARQKQTEDLLNENK